MTKKITKATFKSFLKKNEGNIWVKQRSRFDGCCDGIRYAKNPEFVATVKSELTHENECGYKGIWLVGGSRDYFTSYDDGLFQGISVSNCCGCFIVAKKI